MEFMKFDPTKERIIKMEFMKFDPTKEKHLFLYKNKIIATICSKDGYFLLETYPPLIHNRVVLHTRDKDDVMLEATQYLCDVARQTVDKINETNEIDELENIYILLVNIT